MWKFICVVVLSFQIFTCVVGGDVKLGDDCFDEEECIIENAICNSSDICECSEGYVASPNNTNCLFKAVKVGDKCEISEQCSSIPSAKCVAKMCVVADVATIIPPTTDSTKSTKECSEDSQCPSIHQICKNGTCLLSPIVPKTLDLDKATIGMPCSNDTDCPLQDSICNSKLCQCKDGFVSSLNLKYCLPKAKSLGDTCFETTQCLSLNGSICEKGKCTKIEIKLFNSIGDIATGKNPLLTIGSTCQNNDDCKNIVKALCLENVCQCQDNYITSVTSNSCLAKAKKEGDPCEIDKQCEDLKGAVCSKNKCVKPAVAGTKIGSGSSTIRISQLAVVILFIKFIFF